MIIIMSNYDKIDYRIIYCSTSETDYKLTFEIFWTSIVLGVTMVVIGQVALLPWAT